MRVSTQSLDVGRKTKATSVDQDAATRLKEIGTSPREKKKIFALQNEER
jgi:hypothetical protein